MTRKELVALLDALEDAVEVKGHSARRRIKIDEIRAEILNALPE